MGGGDVAKVLQDLNMQLMSVDSSVELKYMEILQEDDEEKRKGKEDEVWFKTGSPTKQYLNTIYHNHIKNLLFF